VVDVSSTLITTNNLIAANNLSDLTSDTTARTNLGLGTAATLDVGTSANNIVQLNGSAQLPAVDGSLLTGIVAIPTGAILLWSGSTGSIPSGWVICDGTNSTPDLRNLFVVGAGDTYAVGATGGSNTVTLDSNTLPGHTHTGTTASDGAHTHNVSGNTSNTGAHTHTLSGNTSNTGAHTHSGSTSNTGAHQHTLVYAFGGPVPSAPRKISGTTTFTGSVTDSGACQSAGNHSHNFNTNSDGDHSHTLSGNAESAGDHSHTLSGTADSAGDHTHTFTTASTGGGGAHENRPPYYALAYIMKT
jgi:microcystin-dependent protein